MVTPNHKILLPRIKNGKLFLGCAIVATVIVGGSLGAASKAANEISANQVSQSILMAT